MIIVSKTQISCGPSKKISLRGVHGYLGCILDCGGGRQNLPAAVSDFHSFASASIFLFFFKITQVLHRRLHWCEIGPATGGARPHPCKKKGDFIKGSRRNLNSTFGPFWRLKKCGGGLEN